MDLKTKNADKNVIGQNIKKHRKAKKMNQQKLSQLTGITQNNISRYENGKVVPSTRNLMLIAEKLGVNFTDLIDEGWDTSWQGMGKSSAALGYSFSERVNSVKIKILIDHKGRLQKDLDELLSQENISGARAKSLMDEIEKYNKDISDLTTDLDEEFDLKNLEETQSSIENMTKGISFLTLASLLSSLFRSNNEQIYLDKIIERYLLITEENFKIIFPYDEHAYWQDAFDFIHDINDCLKSETNKEKNSFDLFCAIMNFFEKPEFGITEEMILEKFGFLLPEEK